MTRRSARTSEGSRWRRFRALVLRTYGPTCFICGHGIDPRNFDVDHVLSVTEHPELEWDLSNLRPAHGIRSPCPECSRLAGEPVRCNAVKSGYSLERARRIIAERTGKDMPGSEQKARSRDW